MVVLCFWYGLLEVMVVAVVLLLLFFGCDSFVTVVHVLRFHVFSTNGFNRQDIQTLLKKDTQQTGIQLQDRQTVVQSCWGYIVE